MIKMANKKIKHKNLTFFINIYEIVSSSNFIKYIPKNNYEKENCAFNVKNVILYTMLYIIIY